MRRLTTLSSKFLPACMTTELNTCLKFLQIQMQSGRDDDVDTGHSFYSKKEPHNKECNVNKFPGGRQDTTAPSEPEGMLVFVIC